MKRILMAASALTLVGGAAFAGGYNTPVVEAPAAAPAPVYVPANANWTGWYAGAQLGYGKPDEALRTDGAFGGVNAGYLRDYGNVVVGGELAYNAANMDQGDAGKVKDFTDLKLIAGVPYGKWLPYGTVGASYVKADIDGASRSDTLPMVGIGVKYQVNDQWAVGSELAYRKGNGFDGTGEDLNMTTLGANVAFRF
ncbi:MAG TPA: outer membrane beta-barrel protein [Paenirhodobacter sp.]